MNSRRNAPGPVLEAIPDPEIPVVSIRELGILREINERDGELEVVITPTYSGCPAMGQIEDDVRAALAANDLPRPGGHAAVAGLDHRLDHRGGKEKLRGLRHLAAACHCRRTTWCVSRGRAASQPTAVPCPHCGSDNTTETSHFSSTACKALYKCLDCLEPFDYFKPY